MKNNINIINQTINKFRSFTQWETQENWLYFPENLDINSLNNLDLTPWQKVQVNEKNYIVFSKGRKVQWLAQKFIIPEYFNGYLVENLTLRLSLIWWAENAKIYLNGDFIQEGDLFDSSTRIILTSTAQKDQEITVLIRLVSPNHDIGALMESKVIYENNTGFCLTTFADELDILQKYLEKFNPDQLKVLEEKITQINWQLVSNRETFHHHLRQIRESLMPLTTGIKQRQFYLVGNTHLDLAWLWETKETWQVAQNTFTSVLNLQQEYKDLTFCHSTPVLYEWIEENRPDLFTQIQEKIKAKKWEVIGGMWVEPEVNIISGESLIRQLLYGQRYNLEKFGEITQIAWLPDSFGFCWQLPQIFLQSGIKYFVTGKLHWNDSNEFPHGVFWWQSPDNSQVLTLISPPNKAGVMNTNPLTMVDYWLNWESQTQLEEMLWLPGVGDHGGGPTRDMLEVQNKWAESPFFPKSNFTTNLDYLKFLESKAQENKFPIWEDELYLEFHRGCYTTHGEQKYFNRRCEMLLYQVELLHTINYILWQKSLKNNANSDVNNSINNNLDLGLKFQKEKYKIEELWKDVLFNQFHDILPGTSITEVFTEANEKWQNVEDLTSKMIVSYLQAISSYIKLNIAFNNKTTPILVFNSLNWERSDFVTVELPQGNWQFFNNYGEEIFSQLIEGNQWLFLAENIPSVGYKVFYAWKIKREDKEINFIPKDFILENELVKIEIDQTTGEISNFYDKTNQKQVLKAKGNELQFFTDQGQYWDGWNIDPNYESKKLAPSQLISIQWLEKGDLRQTIRIVKNFGQSQFTQDYILYFNSPLLTIDTKVNWHEDHILVKTAFPLTIESDKVSYEMPCGTIDRKTISENKLDQAKWEVSALHWASLSNGDYGVTLFNNCKYGYDSKPDQLRLTLLRSPRFPDPLADKGKHQFSYGIYPHIGNWKTAKIVHKGYEFNSPLQSILINHNNSQNKFLTGEETFLNLQSESLILMAFKLGEEKDFILRCYEAYGETTQINLEGNLNLEIKEKVDLLERFNQDNNLKIIEPWKIVSYGIK
jgi:alpha-mannosidase